MPVPVPVPVSAAAVGAGQAGAVPVGAAGECSAGLSARPTPRAGGAGLAPPVPAPGLPRPDRRGGRCLVGQPLPAAAAPVSAGPGSTECTRACRAAPRRRSRGSGWELQASSRLLCRLSRGAAEPDAAFGMGRSAQEKGTSGAERYQPNGSAVHLLLRVPVSQASRASGSSPAPRRPGRAFVTLVLGLADDLVGAHPPGRP